MEDFHPGPGTNRERYSYKQREIFLHLPQAHRCPASEGRWSLCKAQSPPVSARNQAGSGYCWQRTAKTEIESWDSITYVQCTCCDYIHVANLQAKLILNQTELHSTVKMWLLYNIHTVWAARYKLKLTRGHYGIMCTCTYNVCVCVHA